MNTIKLGVAILTMSSMAAVQAQVEEVSDDPSRAEIATETTMKSYTLNYGDQTIENSVKITTSQEQAIEFAKESKGKVNKERVLDKKMITKMVAIDNDADEAYDEKIRFSYRADAPSDFVLLSDSDEIFVALDNGENLDILTNERFMKSELEADRDTYVYTDKNGEEVEFFIRNYENLDTMSESSSYKK